MKKVLRAVLAICLMLSGWWWFGAAAPVEKGLDDFYKTLDNEPAPVLTPAQALERFRIAPGFTIELVAAEPLVEDPVAMAWDEFGRLYVVEMRGYMPDAYGNGRDEPVGRIVRLSDTNGDGRMDESILFLDKLVNPRAVAVTNAGILVGEPPNLWLCELPEPDAICEQRLSIGDYAANVDVGNVEHLENGLIAGLDNWLYNAKSTRSFRLRDDELEQREGPNRGQWGMDFDEHGRLFYNHNSTWLQADFFAGEDVVVPSSGNSYAGLGVNLTDPSEVFSVRVNPGVNRAYLSGTLRADGRLHKVTGVSGLAVYRGDQFGLGYANDVFVPEVAANAVAHLRVREEGMAMTVEQKLYEDEQWGQREFLASTDERFRPVDAMNGPDGNLYIIDMYRGIVQDTQYLTKQLREQILQRKLDKPLGMGRIWRVRRSDTLPSSPVANFSAASGEQLVAFLRSENGWVRDTAQRLLLAREASLGPALAELAVSDNGKAAAHALWTMEGRGELQRDLVMQVATMQDPWRQVQALRAGAAQLSMPDMLDLSAALAQAPERVQTQLALEYRRHAPSGAVLTQLRKTLIANLDSAYVRQAIVRAVHGQEMNFLPALLEDQGLATESEAAANVLGAIAANAYRQLRTDMKSAEPANPALNTLLALVAGTDSEQAWQQVAMLTAFRGLTLTTGFEPVHLATQPPIFAISDDSISDDLSEARLSGRRAFTWPGDLLAQGIEPLTPEQRRLMQLGETFYAHCAGCHAEDGAGIAGLAPALAGADWVTGPPEWLGRIILQGLVGPLEVNGESLNGVMPQHGHLPELTDEVLAGLMTYLRRAWGNGADAVSPEQAETIRTNSAEREQPWTAAGLREVPIDLGFGAFLGDYSVSFITIAISQQAEGLHMKATVGGGGLLTQVDDNLFLIESDGQSVKLEFIVESDGAVNKLILHRDGQDISAERDE
ncbi:MAG: mono/diheme cytochrome c family protein/glucose/arabinose dehydrogenase [Halioglobus sp.]|jgi:mono/diheme cytochrome c family protein/glucose/arabinose dehydrogenase